MMSLEVYGAAIYDISHVTGRTRIVFQDHDKDNRQQAKNGKSWAPKMNLNETQAQGETHETGINLKG